MCSSSVSQFTGLAQLGVVSWSALCELFESKVDSLMDMGWWLFIMVDDADSLVGDAYNRWARVLIGADWFRNAGTCSSELGWKMSGFQRVVLAFAMRRAKLWSSAADDWHRSFFTLATWLGCGWAA